MTSNDETTADEPQRIDITEIRERLTLGLWTDETSMDLIAELKRCYEKIDRLTSLTVLTNPEVDPTGRHLTETEMKRLHQYLDGADLIAGSMDIMSANIAEAQDKEAANLLVQWCLNVALSHYDSIMESIELSEG